MADNTLAIRLEARIRDFEKQMAKASGSATREFKKIERQAQSTSAKLTGIFKSFGGGLLAGVAAGGVAGIVNQIGKIAAGIADIGAEAKRAGVSAQAFQEISYVAKQNGVAVDALVDGLKELNLRADEWIVTGKGPAAEAFARLGFTADELKRKLQDPSALFSEIIGKLQKLDTAAQIRIADEIFGGTGGEQFVRFIEQGEAGIKRTVSEARRLGVVLSDDVISKAAELDRKFNKVTETVGTALKRAIVEAATALGAFIEEFNRLDQRRLDAQRAADAGAYVGGLVRPKGAVLTTPTRDRATALDARMAGTLATELSVADQRLISALQKRYSESAKAAIPGPSRVDGGSSAGKAETSFDASIDAFAAMIGYTEEYRREQELANQKIEDFGNLAVNAGNSLASALSDGKLEAQEFIPIIQDVISELIRMGAVTKLLNLLFGGGGFNPTTGGFAAMLGLSEGGYTGNGGKYQPAGIVHGGEFVFSKEAVQRAGVGNLEAMHRNLRGYADGGFVAPAMPRLAGGAHGQSGPLVSVEVINNAARTNVREERKREPDGRELRRIIIEDVKAEMASGGFDKPMTARYGNKLNTTSR